MLIQTFQRKGIPNGLACSIGKSWQQEKGESLETRYVESLLVVYVQCVEQSSGAEKRPF
jgi:hypothetical protein